MTQHARPAELDALLDHVAERLDHHARRGADVRLTAVDGTNALAFVIVRPSEDDPDRVTVEAAANGMDKPAAAYVLRHVADQFDPPAAEPELYPSQIGVFCDQCGRTVEHDYVVSDDMTQAARFEVAREHLRRNEGWSCTSDGDLCPSCAPAEQPATAVQALTFDEQPPANPGTVAADLDQLATDLDHIAATTRTYAHGPQHDAYRAGLRVAARIARNRGTGNPPGDAEQQQPRRVLTDAEYSTTWQAAARAASSRIGRVHLAETIAATLAAVGILTPAPAGDDLDTDYCTAVFPDPEGGWHQCAEEPGHDPADGHDSGEWSWPADAPDAIDPQPAEQP